MDQTTADMNAKKSALEAAQKALAQARVDKAQADVDAQQKLVDAAQADYDAAVKALEEANSALNTKISERDAAKEKVASLEKEIQDAQKVEWDLWTVNTGPQIVN